MTNRRRRIVAAAVVLPTSLAVLLLARSPATRASFSAAYQAFRDPSRVHGDKTECDDASRAAPLELEQPEIAGDLEPVSPADLEDASADTIASFTLPDLPIPLSRRTMHFVHYFAADEDGRKAFAERFRRGGRYSDLIAQALRDAELPEDLVWLVAIESGFNPQAVSPKGAAGLFQFMPATGARYGLAQSEEIDERKSIPKSIAAGIAHLHDLYALYHQWDLALAAYNLGHESLDDAIERFKAKRSPRDAKAPIELKDLAEAKLIPKETANFVPQIQAFALVAANRGRFGLDDLDPAGAFDLGEIAVPAGARLGTVARAAGISLSTLRDYNPDLLRDHVPAVGDTVVNLPADRVERARAALPTFLAREIPSDDHDAAPAAVAAKVAPTAKEIAPPAPAIPPPPDTWTLPNGVAVERTNGPASEDVTISARIEIAPRAGGKASRALDIETVKVRSGDLGKGLGKAAERVGALVRDDGEAAAELRRRASEPRLRDLAKTPYGPSWVALGDALFPAGHPLAGTVLGAPLEPFAPVVFARPPARGALKITVSLAGAEHDRAASLTQQAFGDVMGSAQTVPAFPREERVAVKDHVPYPRVLVGWIGPRDADSSTLRLAIVLLAQGNVGRASRALSINHKIAAQVRGSLDLGEHASVAAIECVPAVPHDSAETLRALDEAIAGFADSGPTQIELDAAKGIVRDRLQRERVTAGSRGESRTLALARIDSLLHAVDETHADDVRDIVKKVFAPDHRVIVTTEPDS